MVRVLVIIEKGPTSYGAYAPDIPGIIGLGDTAEEALQSMKESLQIYDEYLKDERLPLPEMNNQAVYMDMALS
jgi:predicted RNase H-like HicB family nuclease